MAISVKTASELASTQSKVGAYFVRIMANYYVTLVCISVRYMHARAHMNRLIVLGLFDSAKCHFIASMRATSVIENNRHVYIVLHSRPSFSILITHVYYITV